MLQKIFNYAVLLVCLAAVAGGIYVHQYHPFFIIFPDEVQSIFDAIQEREQVANQLYQIAKKCGAI
jgi:hypothetical protein